MCWRIARMFRRCPCLMSASAALLLLTGGCGFSHPLPLRSVYDRLSVDGQAARQLAAPSDTQRTDDGLLTVLSRRLDWERETGGVERIVIVRDACGAIRAKHYAVEAEELSLVSMTYKRIN